MASGRKASCGSDSSLTDGITSGYRLAEDRGGRQSVTPIAFRVVAIVDSGSSARSSYLILTQDSGWAFSNSSNACALVYPVGNDRG